MIMNPLLLIANESFGKRRTSGGDLATRIKQDHGIGYGSCGNWRIFWRRELSIRELTTRSCVQQGRNDEHVFDLETMEN